MDQLDIYSDVICPWCYVGQQHMRKALALLEGEGLRFTIGWRPFQLNPDMPKAGVPRDEYRKAKFGSLLRSRQLDAEVAEAARQSGIVIRHDRMRRTPNTLDAHRLIRWAAEHGRQDALVERLFTDYFRDGRDVGDRAVLAAAAEAAGLNRHEAETFLASNAGSAEIRAEDESARRAGLTGVPTFVLDNHVLFSGAVPPDVFAEALAKARKVLAQRAA